MTPVATIGSIGTPFQPWEALDEALLDPPIVPLVRALNGTGWVRTVFSCGGHPEEPDSIARGRRQAHVDVVTCDLRRWYRYVQECRQRMPVRVYVARPSGAETLHLTPRVRETSLGRVPDWLKPHLPPVPGRSPRGQRAAPAPRWWRLLVPRAADGSDRGWHYRRLAFEPFPYTAPPAAIRTVLNSALQVAEEALGEV